MPPTEDAPITVVADLGAAGAVDEQTQALIREASGALDAGDLTVAANLIDEARVVALRASAQRVYMRPLTVEEVAQSELDAASTAKARAEDRTRTMMSLRARRDRLLSQTDVLALPDAALPVDVPAAIREALAANRPAWLAFRQQLRDYMDGVDDPLDPPPFPEQPAAPRVVFT